MKLVGDVICKNNLLIVTSKHFVPIEDGEYELELKKPSSKRSDRQNKYLWALVNDICKKQDGNIVNSYELYNQLLEMAGIEYDDYILKHDALESARSLLHHVKVVKQEVKNHTVWDYCWVFKGISKMTKEEANRLIDVAINYAAEVGIYTPYWEDLLKNERN